MGVFGLLGLVTALTLFEAQAHSQVTCSVKKDEVLCEIDVRELYLDELKDDIESGFQNNLIWKVYLFPESEQEPIALTIRRQLQIYDIWDEVHFVRDQFDDAPVEEYHDMESLLDDIAYADDVLVAEVDSVESGRYFVAIRIELNPLSDEEIAEIRSWIQRNRGGHRTLSKGDRTFFGTFVSIFVNIRPGTAEAVLQIQSEPFEVP